MTGREQRLGRPPFTAAELPCGVGLPVPLPSESPMQPLRHKFPRRAALLLALLSMSASAVAAMQARPVEWQVAGQAFSGVLVYDDDSSDRRPGLVMVPDWMGVTDGAVAQAKD